MTPLAERDLNWHRSQADRLDMTGLEQGAENRRAKQDWRGAAVYLAAIFARTPGPETALNLAKMLRRARDERAAQAHLKAALTHWPQAPGLWYCLAESSTAIGDFAQGWHAWDQLIALQKQPGQYPLMRALACLRLSGEEDAAQRFLNTHAERLRQQISRKGMQLLRKGQAGLAPVTPGLYLVSGNNGSGKSTLGHFLQALGHVIIDADREIASFCANGQFSDLRHDLTREFPDATVTWGWPAPRVAQCFEKIDPEREVAFVIGGFGSTVAPYISRFRHVLHLTAPDHVIAARLEKRNSPSHAPGSKGFQSALRRNRREAVPDYPARIIPANRPVAAICAACLAEISAPDPAHTASDAA